MSDDRLFASNNAIGRKWYCLNLLILAVLTGSTYYIFDAHIIPNVLSETYEIIANGFLYFAFAIYIITFFALIERRLYDVTGTRDSKSYRNVSSVLTFSVFVIGFYFFCLWKNPTLPFSIDGLSLVAMIFAGIFAVITIVLAFLKGSISNLTYEQYRRKIKYE